MIVLSGESSLIPFRPSRLTPYELLDDFANEFPTASWEEALARIAAEREESEADILAAAPDLPVRWAEETARPPLVPGSQHPCLGTW